MNRRLVLVLGAVAAVGLVAALRGGGHDDVAPAPVLAASADSPDAAPVSTPGASPFEGLIDPRDAAPEPGPSPALAGPVDQARRPTRESLHHVREAGATLSSEIALLERARRAMDQGVPGEALQLLDRHARQYPASPLTGEARLMRKRAQSMAQEEP